MNDSSQPHPPAPLAETGNALVTTTEPAGPIEPRWTPGRMADFIVELAATQCAATAARRVGMSRQSAYKLRAREEGEAFDLGWAIALEQDFERLYRSALARAVNGIEVPVYQRGELVGTRRHFDERLTCFMITTGKRRFDASMPRERRAALDSWTGQLEALIAQVRDGEAAEDDGEGENA